jgi:hypothetical protein
VYTMATSVWQAYVRNALPAIHFEHQRKVGTPHIHAATLSVMKQGTAKLRRC